MSWALVRLVQRMITVRFVCRWDRFPILLLRLSHRTELQRPVRSTEVIPIDRTSDPSVDDQAWILLSEVRQNCLVEFFWVVMRCVSPKKGRMIVFNQLLDLRHDFLRYNRFTPLWPIGLRISGVA